MLLLNLTFAQFDCWRWTVATAAICTLWGFIAVLLWFNVQLYQVYRLEL